MRRLLLSAAAVAGLAGALSVTASAAPVTSALSVDTAPTASAVRKVDYYWQHRHWHHREWDRHHHRWRYYD